MSNRIYPLIGCPQCYTWGGTKFIASLIGKPNDEQMAEWWLGAHPKAPSKLHDGFESIALDQAISADPIGILGEEAARHFGRLPFLLKVLDVENGLSIQVHPDKQQAQDGFTRESVGHPPTRNYLDDNHKPEMMVALSRFHLLHGFRPEGAICLHLAAHNATRDLAALVAERGLRYAYSHIIEMPCDEVAHRMRAVINSLQAWPTVDEEVPEYWLARAARSGGTYADAGLFAFFFMNLVTLDPGQAMYLPPRLPHAYLRGQNIELMANSDNVLRAGLTSKHVDKRELLSVLDYRSARPCLFQPRIIHGGVIYRYRVDCDDFAMDDIRFDEETNVSLSSFGPEILFVLDGEVTLQYGRQFMFLPRGSSAFVEANTAYRLLGAKGARLVRAVDGLDRKELPYA